MEKDKTEEPKEEEKTGKEKAGIGELHTMLGNLQASKGSILFHSHEKPNR
jgi:hypothetical protein